MTPIENVAIVGGGPAGAHCAYNLTRQGIRPVILDNSHPREKICGGGISPIVLKRFPFLEKFRSQGSTFGNFRIISSINAQVMTKGFENGFCISRKILDQKLLKMATQNGAKIIKEKVLDVQKEGKIWKITTNKRTLSTSILVGADGVNSVVRHKMLGPISAEHLGLTFGYFTSSLKKDNATIKFLDDIPGYIWVFPGKGYSNIGVGSKLKYGRMLKYLLDAFLNSHFPEIGIITKYAAMLPSASDPQFFNLPCAGPNWILIGDAAGHVDPITGGGILYALWGGELAAQAIIEENPKSFDMKWKKEYGKTLEERCKNKEAFYDPLKFTFMLIMGLAKKTYFLPPK